MKPEAGVMVPSDCSRCGSTDVHVSMGTPTEGRVVCPRCGHFETFTAARMETFDEMLRGAM